MASWLGPPVIKRDFGTDGGSWTRSPALIVLHSTEGTGTTDYQDGAVAPHFTLDPEDGKIWQHVSLGKAARALKNTSGGVETNRAGAVQVEIIGTCDPSHRGDKGWTYLPDMDAAMAARVKVLLDLIHDALPAIPLTASVTFEPYPDPGYGSGYPRLSNKAWGSYKGLCGHQHVPEQTHGDPGDIPLDLILKGPADDEETQAMIGIVKSDQPGLSAQFLYTGTELTWIETSDHKSGLNYVYGKNTGGKALPETTLGGDQGQAMIQQGFYGWLPPAAPDPTSAGVQPGWDFSAHRVDQTHAPGLDRSADPVLQAAREWWAEHAPRGEDDGAP